MRPLLALPIVLAGCNLAPVDFMDGATTYATLADNTVTEANPLIRGMKPGAGTLTLLALKSGGKDVLEEAGMEPETAKAAVESVSAGWTCNNLAVFANAEPVVALSLGVLCGTAYWGAAQPKTGYTIEVAGRDSGKIYVEAGEFSFDTLEDCQDAIRSLDKLLVGRCGYYKNS